MFARFENLEEKLHELEQRLADPSQVANQEEFAKLAKDHAHVSKLHELYTSFKQNEQELAESNELLKSEEDEEMQELIRNEVADLTVKAETLEHELKIMLLPTDPNDSKNAIVEIRAGTGGDEAAIFAGDLYRMYSKYCEQNNYKVEIMNSNPSERGGFKEIIFNVIGTDAFGKLKFESGVHRVQRVPDTETQGRVHTSAASVVILPEVEDVEVVIKSNELKVDVYRSSGPGGQSVNTTDSAVRITHIPTGMVVTCQDEKSQLKNKNKALKVLKARLFDLAQREQNDSIASQRKTMVAGGDRSAKIRTYNFPQGRVTDHRINLTLYKLDRIVFGEIDELIEKLQLADRTEKLAHSIS